METERTTIHDGKQRASVTLMALCLTIVLSIALSSYLTLCLRSYQLSTRMLHEDQSKQLAQLGLEEALWSLNQNNWTSSGPANASSWTTAGTSQSITLSYSPMAQDSSGQLILTVSNYASTGPVWPTITSTATITTSDGKSVTKSLQATTQPAPLFGNAIASVNDYVSFMTGGTVDSWNSDPDNNPATPMVPYSFTAGDPVNYNAVVAGNTNGTNGVVLNQARINGYVSTFGNPISYSTSGSPPGQVKGPNTPAVVDADSSRMGKSAFIPGSAVFTVTPPALPTGGFDLLSFLAAILTIAPANSGIYSAPSGLSMPSNSILGLLLGTTLYIDRPVQMVVDGDFTIGSSLLGIPAQIVIRPPNGELEVFVTGDGTIGGNGIQNQTHDPSKLSLFFSSSSTTNSVKYTTTTDFYGVIYSVNKPIDIQTNATFYGALLSGGAITFTANATAPVFHYDTALRNRRFKNVTTPYLIKQLTEP